MDPTPETLYATTTVNRIPRKMPVPEGPPGPPAIDPALVAAPILERIEQLDNPLAARIAGITRGLVEGAPEVVSQVAAALPAPSTVFGLLSGVTGAAGLVSGVTGAAAKLLAVPAQAVPYLGPAVAGWAALSGPVTAALGVTSAGFGALATGSGALPSILQQWGNLAPPNAGAGTSPSPAAAIPPPPVAV